MPSPALVYVASLAPGSRDAMWWALGVAARIFRREDSLGAAQDRVQAARFPWWGVEYIHMEGLRAELSGRYSYRTANRVLTAVRQVLLRCRRMKLMSAEAYALAVDVRGVRGHAEPAGRALEGDEFRDMMRASDAGRRIGARDRALLALAAGCGLRRAEVVALDHADYQPAGDGRRLAVEGKGNKQRHVFVPAPVAAMVDEWLQVRGPMPGPLMMPMKKSGDVVTERRLSGKSVTKILNKLSDRAGLEHVSPHDLRRTFISELLDRGVDLATVSKLAGHEKVETTRGYDRRGDKVKAEAAAVMGGFFEGGAGRGKDPIRDP